MQYRNELKHYITLADRLALRARLAALMERDPHAGPDGIYTVHSLYFDDLRDTALLEKLNGVGIRDKFRLRYYNDETGTVQLEKKSKRNSMCMKRTALLTRDEAQSIIDGETEWMASSKDALVLEFHAALAGGLLPRAVVDYEREPFIYPAGNVRVTLDHDIRTGMELGRFLARGHVSVPVPGLDGAAVLEVKWDEFLPSFIRDAVQLPGRRASAFSKYAACRIYNC